MRGGLNYQKERPSDIILDSKALNSNIELGRWLDVDVECVDAIRSRRGHKKK